MPCLLLNATTLHVGGALQVAANFILEALNDDTIDWRFAISRRVWDELEPLLPEDYNAARFHLFQTSPAKSLGARDALIDLEKAVSPAAVFTLFGPAYVKFSAPHLLGYADPWVSHPNRYALATIRGIIGKLKFKAERAYKASWLKKAENWVVESDIAKRGVMRITGASDHRVNIVPNGCRDEFRQITTAAKNIGSDTTINVLYISAYYLHKNFEIVPYVARALKDLNLGKDFHFMLTIDPSMPKVAAIMDTARQLGVAEQIDCIGRVAVAAAPRLYEKSHIAFVPTLLESFSATYSEALTCGLPLVTTDLPFATALLGNAASYFRPNDAQHAAQQIAHLVNTPEITIAQIKRGLAHAALLPNSAEKYSLYRDLIGQLCSLDQPKESEHIETKVA